MCLSPKCQLCDVKTFDFNKILGRTLCSDCDDEYKAVILGLTSNYYDYIALILDHELRNLKKEEYNGT